MSVNLSRAMTKKTGFLIVLALLLGGLSLYLNKDRFKSDPIQISHRSMPARAFLRRDRPNTATVNPVVFMLNRPVRLTSVKVVLDSNLETNLAPHATWELVSDSRSAPVKDLLYGGNIPGMKPAVKGAAPEPLQPGVKYRLLLKTDSLQLEHEFTPAPRMP
jgi:hypothetical protein